MKKLISALLIAISAAGITAHAENTDLIIKYNGNVLNFNQSPVIVDGKTLVQLRPIAEAMDLEIVFKGGEESTVTLYDKDTTVVFTMNSNKVLVNNEESQMITAPILRNNSTFIPVRELAEPFGKTVEYNGKTQTVTIEDSKETDKEADKETDSILTESEKDKMPSTGSGKYNFTYYYQSQPDLALDNNGRGYCWVCAYAMLISDASGKVVTPIDVANINIKKGYSGNFMSGHATLVSEFGCKLVPALAEDSVYYDSFNTKNRGETNLKVSSDEEAKAAIIEALDNFPYGVIVRYEGYPHSMVAVAYDEENIYFNDPGLKTGEHVTFENTCLKNFKLSDISCIQAISVK